VTAGLRIGSGIARRVSTCTCRDEDVCCDARRRFDVPVTLVTL